MEEISPTDHEGRSESNETTTPMIKRKTATMLQIAGLIAGIMIGTSIGYSLKNKDTQPDVKITKVDLDSLATKNAVQYDTNNTKDNK